MKNRLIALAVILGAAISLAGAETPATQPAATNPSADAKDGEIAQLKRENAQLLATIREQNKQIAELKKGALAKTSSPKGTDNTANQTPASENEKKVVLTAKEFNALPKGNKTRKPAGFRDVAIDEVGYGGGVVKSVIDDSTVLLEVVLEDKDGYVLMRVGNDVVTRKLIVEGISTKGVADDTRLNLGWCKVVSTAKFGGTTYLVARPIVQENAPTPNAK